MTQAKKTEAALVAEQERLRRLGEFFKMNREKAGLTVEAVAQSLELETQVYARYESGQLAMPLEDVFALTNLLNVAPEEVMDLVHEMYLLGSGAQ